MSLRSTENVEEKIATLEKHLTTIIQEDSPQEWAQIRTDLAAAYQGRTDGDHACNLDRAIELYEEALTVATRDVLQPKPWASITMNLAIAYHDRVHGSRQENLERAIELYQQVLTVRTLRDMPEAWAPTTRNLGIAYFDRIKGRRAENLEWAIELFTQVIEETSLSAPLEWAKASMNLAMAYHERIYGTKAENIEQTIRFHEQALTVANGEGCPELWAAINANLGSAYQKRILGERAENLELAIHFYRQSLTVITRQTDPVQWATIALVLGITYRNRIRGVHATNVEEAINLYKQALEIKSRPTAPFEWAHLNMHLANAYQSRILGERAHNLESAIALYEAAREVKTRTEAPRDWSEITDNLANAFQDRILGDRAQNIEKAISLYEDALKVRTREEMRIEWANTTMNLAIAYKSRILGSRKENIDHSIQLYEKIRSTLQEIPLEWARATMNLANAYRDRIGEQREENLEKAIALHQQALIVFTPETAPLDWSNTVTNLALVYQDRVRGSREENIRQALNLYERALKLMTLDTMPFEHRRIQTLYGDLLFSLKAWESASAAYRSALAAHESVFMEAATFEGRSAELREIRTLPSRLSYCLVQQVDLPSALAVLEHGRIRLLAEGLAVDRLLKGELQPVDRDELESIQMRIDSLDVEARLPPKTPGARDYVAVAAQLRQARAEIRAVLKRIKSYLPRFGAQSELSISAHDATLIYIAATSEGGFALSVTSDNPDAVQVLLLPQLTEEELYRQTNLYFDAYDQWRAFPKRNEYRQNSLDVLDQVLKWTWDVAIKYVWSSLSPTATNILIPIGRLAFLPLHAAWTEDEGTVTGRRYALDAGIIAYAPSAEVFSAAQKRAIQIAADSILAVTDPHLPSSTPEVEASISYFDRKKVLRRPEITNPELIADCKSYSVWHFACHGRAEPRSPLDSGLGPGLLSLRDFLAMKVSNTRMAALSACETGVSGIELPDEVIGLPTGLLQAGVPGVVGSMWLVHDISTRQLMTRFYELWRGNGNQPAAALRLAQIGLRDTNNGEYTHPHFWAAFSYFGA